MRTSARRSGCAVLVVAVALTIATPPAGAASKPDPKSAKAIAALLAAKKLGCRDFSSANETSDESPTDATASTLPSTLQQLALLLEGADLGTCTVDGQQTLLVAFETAKARRDFEGTLGQLPCAIVQAALPTSPSTSAAATATPSGTSSDITVPLVDVGTRAIVFSTGTEPETDQVDLARAAIDDSSIAAKVKGKVRTFTFHCA